MPDAIIGHLEDPGLRLEQAFHAIAESEMRGLPFFQAQIPIRACGFQLFEQQWVGVVLTPWMLSLLVLPGPQQRWERRKVGEKLALALPCGSVNFTVGEIAGCGQYLACSLMSPLEKGLDADRAVMLAEQSARMALSLPVVDADIPANPGRRELFRRRMGSQPHA